jgi:hypothetical protein
MQRARKEESLRSADFIAADRLGWTWWGVKEKSKINLERCKRAGFIGENE